MLDAVFSGRQPLTAEQFHARFFSQQDVPLPIVTGVLKILSEQFDADLSRLDSEDDLSRNLKFLWDFDSMADVEIVCALEKTFAIEIGDSEAENAHTVNDIIQLVTRKLARQASERQPAATDSDYS